MIGYEIDISVLETNLHNFVELKQRKLMRDVKSIAEIIRDDIRDNIINSRKVPSGKMAKNTDATKKMKGFNAPMINSGKLHDSISIQPITDGYEVFLRDERNNKIAGYNSTERMMDKIFGRPLKNPHTVPARPFFGIRSAIKKTLRNILNG